MLKVLAENQEMQAVCRKLGFHLQYAGEEHLVKAELAL
jgi:RimJ/RimL family protein N-acetyltransferase